ncbi:MAG TPA: DUF2232 domain-containing protein [Gammaproteobacteria bacterium]
MKILVDWVLSQRYWLVLLAILFAPIFPVVTAALMVLNTLHRGAAQGFATAALGSAALALLAVATAGGWLYGAVAGTVAMLSGAALGALLNWARTLTLGFQCTVLGSLIAAAAVSLFGPAPAVLVEPVVSRVIELLQAGDATPEQLEAVRTLDTMLLGMMFGALFAVLVAVMLLGYWWFALARAEVGFGTEFRALKLGRMLGIVAMVLVTVGLVVQVPVVQNLSPIALFAFLFQGLAVMHAWAYAKQWQPAFVWPVYLILILPWTSLMALLGLAAVGLLDNIFDWRSRLRTPG